MIEKYLAEVYFSQGNFRVHCSIEPTDVLLASSVEFNAFKSQWLDGKCRELNTFLDPDFAQNPKRIIINKSVPEKVATILCSGPKFTEHESKTLTKLLYEMQQIFTETKICLPKRFDVCLNIDWIFNFTYEKDKDGHMRRLDMSHVLPTGYVYLYN